MECPDEVRCGRDVDGGLAADRGVRRADEGGGQGDVGQAAGIGGGDEAGEVGDDAAAEGDDEAVAPVAGSDEFVLEAFLHCAGF